MFTVTQVGSWPRSKDLLRALRDKQKGRMTAGEFDRVADGEVRRCVERQVAASADIVVDGEQRRDNFYSFREELIDLKEAGAAFVQFDEPVLTEIVFSEDCDRRTFM